MSESQHKSKQEYLVDLMTNGLDMATFNQYLLQLKGTTLLTMQDHRSTLTPSAWNSL
jgi:hypothetical protein